ncbi:MAG: HEPN domain-containing protein [bacterium]
MSKTNKEKLSEHLRQRTREWFRKAEHDLAYLQHAPLDLDDPPTDTTGRLAHMVAEYSLKAYLVLNKKKIKKSHDLDEVVNLCIAANQDKEFEALREDCKILSRYKTYFTYPGPIPEVISVEEAKAAIEKAFRIKDFVMKRPSSWDIT